MLSVQVEPPYAQLVETIQNPDGAKLRFRSSPPAGLESFTATVRLTVNLSQPQKGLDHGSLVTYVRGATG